MTGCEHGFHPSRSLSQKSKEKWLSAQRVVKPLSQDRDRLYFSAVMDCDVIRFNRGSLGEVFPDTFVRAMERAGIGHGALVEWTGVSGRAHQFSVNSFS